ncbi:hypothetical protein [Nocardia amamiensis]|uniref:phosphoribosylanthranilate isomerase n=1 Tax=Nocardia amamiensis TaxID=404578 RepID=UPI0034064862
MTAIKICRVREYETARRIVWMGADYLGIHAITDSDLHPHNPAFALNARLVTQDGFDGGVLLTRSSDPTLVAPAIKAGCFRTVQIQAELTTSTWINLAEVCHRHAAQMIAVMDPQTSSVESVRDMQRIADFILYDHIRGGTGRALNLEHLAGMPMSRSFVAGGLTASSVRSVVEAFQPFGVDVQSFTESSPPAKDLTRIDEFIASLRPRQAQFPTITHTPVVAVSISSLTVADLASGSVGQAIDSADLLHLDHNPTGAVEGIGPDVLQTAIEIDSSHQGTVVWDVHLFATPEQVVGELSRLHSQLSLIRVVFLHPLDGLDPLAYRPALTQVRQARARAGVALTASAVSRGDCDALLHACTDLTVGHVLIVAPAVVRDFDAVLIAAIRRVRHLVPAARICLDRALTIPRMQQLHIDEIDEIIVGRDILHSHDPNAQLSEYKAMMR